MAWSTLRMKCPHCGSYAGHGVVETDPSHYRWNDKATAYFKKHFGEDIAYRKRTKECKRCGEHFDSVELTQSFLEKMINRVLQQSSSIADTDRILKKCNAERDSLLRKINAIHKLADVHKK